MNKHDLVNAFGQVCQHVAENIQELLLPHLDEDQMRITPIFEDAHVTDMDQWWEWDNHLALYFKQIDELAAQDPNSRQDNMDAAVEEIQENPRLWAQHQPFRDGTYEGCVAGIKLLPHVAQYAQCLTETEGYKMLDALTKRMDNVIIWPMMTVNTECDDLKQAFYLNVSVVSADGLPLKPKIQNFRRLNV